MTKRFGGLVAVALALACFAGNANGQAVLGPSATYSQNFDGMATTNTAVLPTGWKMSAAGAGSTAGYASSGNLTAVTQAASTGSPIAGGAYNWGNGTTTSDRAIGFMTSGSYASPNSILVGFTNALGNTITSLQIGFDIERYRINTAAANVTFFTSTDGSSWTAQTAGDSGAFSTGTSAYNFSTGTVVSKSLTVSGLSIANNSNFYLRWLFNTTGTNSQGLGLDNLSFTAGTGGYTPQNLTWNTTNGTWDTATTNWTAGAGAIAYTDTDNVTFNSASGGTVTINSTVSPGSVTVSAASGTYTFTGSGKISGSTGLVKSGGGTLVVSNDNDYAGTTTISGGIIQIDGANRLGTGGLNLDGGQLTSSSASALTLAKDFTVTSAGGTINTGAQNLSITSLSSLSGVLTKSGAGNLTITGSLTANTGGGLNVNNGNLILGQSSGTVSLSANSSLTGNLVLNGGIRLNINDSATLSGSGQLQVVSTGTLITNASGNIGGTISAPIVLNSTNTSFTAGSFSGATYTNGNFTTTIGGTTGPTSTLSGLTVNGVISGNSDVDFSNNSTTGGGRGTIVLNAQNTYTGMTTINANTPDVAGTANVKLGINNAISTTSGIVVGTKTGLGLAVLDMNGFNQSVQFLADVAANVSASKFLTITNNGSGNSILTLGGATTPGTAGFGGVISDGTSNNISVVKNGANTQIFSGASTYSGGTTISNGSLFINNTTGSGTGTGVVNVNGGTLGGTGTISGATTVASGGTIRGDSGNGTGTLALASDLTITGDASGGGKIQTTVSRTAANTANSSKLNLTGTSSSLNLAPTGGTDKFTIDLKTGGSALTIGETYTVILATKASGGSFKVGGTTITSGNISKNNYTLTTDFAQGVADTYQLSVSGNNLQLTFTPVPEPGAIFGFSAAGLGLLAGLRRYFRRAV